MEILEVTENKEQYADLLFTGGEQESAVSGYLDKGKLFALYDDFDLKTAAVVVKEGKDTCEIKILATYKMYQGKGYASSLVRHIIQYYKEKCEYLAACVRENEKILMFYEGLGFKYSHAVNDMIYLKLSMK